MAKERIISTEIDLKHQMPEDTVNKYITDITDTGISIHPKEWGINKSSYLKADGTGVFIMNKKNKEIAKYMDNITIGIDDGTQSYMFLDYHSLQMFDKENAQIINAEEYSNQKTYKIGDCVVYNHNHYKCIKTITAPKSWNSSDWQLVNINSYVYLSDLRNEQGVLDIEDYIVVDSYNFQDTSFPLTLNPIDGESYFVKVNDQEINTIFTSVSDFDETLQYVFGQYVYYNGEYYICIVTQATLGVWDETEWKRSTPIIARPYQDIGLYLVGAYVTYDDNYYRCIREISSPKPFDSDDWTEVRSVEKYKNTIVFNSSLNRGDQITINYITDDARAKAYTLGYRTEKSTIGAFSYVEGYNNIASGPKSHAEGQNTIARGDCGHAEGFGTMTLNGHAEGYETVASGRYSHAEGFGSTSSEEYSHAEGNYTIAQGGAAHAEGALTYANEIASHAEGASTIAQGYASHAEGQNTTASGNCSHAEGYKTEAKGDYSHTQNYYTIAQQETQTAIGKYNNNKTDTAFEIGNGSDLNNRKNAFDFTWDGNIRMSLDMDATSGIDKDICNALIQLNWKDVIVPDKQVFVDLAYYGAWGSEGTVIDNNTVYKSISSYHRANTWDTAKITFSGYKSFKIYVRSYAESTYDYVLVSTLNNDYLANCTTTSAMRDVYSNTTYTKAYTRGKQSNINYEEVVFSDLDPYTEYYFYVIYQKDSSTDVSDDRGYFYIVK